MQTSAAIRIRWQKEWTKNACWQLRETCNSWELPTDNAKRKFNICERINHTNTTVLMLAANIKRTGGWKFWLLRDDFEPIGALLSYQCQLHWLKHFQTQFMWKHIFVENLQMKKLFQRFSLLFSNKWKFSQWKLREKPWNKIGLFADEKF